MVAELSRDNDTNTCKQTTNCYEAASGREHMQLKRKVFLCVMTIVFLLTNMSEVPSVKAAQEERGNSTSNINMGGSMAYDGKEIYYDYEGEQE